MKKIFAISFLSLSCLLYAISSSGDIMKEVVSYRNSTNSALSSDWYKYGDLYGFSYLPEFKIVFNSDPTVIQLKKYNCPKIIDLYTVHDSYLSPIFVKSDSIFCGVNKYYSFTDENNTIALDTSKVNILVIEIVERNLRDYVKKKNTLQVSNSFNNMKMQIYSSLKSAYKVIFNSNINQNLEYNAFGYRYFMPLRELKAEMNYKLFNRVDPTVVVSADKKYLYYYPTINPAVNTSSFNPVSDQEIEGIVNELNYKYNYYKSLGFREVYFSIMPNPVTILNTENYTYNQLIPRVQNNKNLKMRMIDIYSIFKNQNVQLYNRADTHWTLNGFHLWINELNRDLSYYAAFDKK